MEKDKRLFIRNKNKFNIYLFIFILNYFIWYPYFEDQNIFMKLLNVFTNHLNFLFVYFALQFDKMVN